uniref:Uncharacterized protein n=1 Tax=Piliocolobus tephrosceles TaxID=591936 RepID=A0A8C9LRA1_9PRIM
QGTGSDLVCSINVSHYELQVEIGRGFDNLTSVHLAWHTPAGALVTIKVTNLENCNEERLKVLQKAMILSHFFWHPNITTYWTVFSVDKLYLKTQLVHWRIYYFKITLFKGASVCSPFGSHRVL